MAKSFHNLQAADRGFDSDNVLTLQLPLTGDAYDDDAARAAYLNQALLRLDGLGETVAVGATTRLPIAHGAWTVSVGAQGRMSSPCAVAENHLFLSQLEGIRKGIRVSGTPRIPL